MKILQLHIKGYRSLRDVEWKPGDLNVVIGPNGTGKSNLLRFLELITAASQGRLGKYVQSAGGMEPLVWDGTADGVDFCIKTSPLEERRDEKKDSLTYHVKMTKIGRTSTFKIGFEQLANYYRVDVHESSQPFKLLERTALKGMLFDENEKGLLAQEEAIPETETLLSLATGPFIANRYISEFQRQLSQWCVYHDVHVNRDAAIRQPAIAQLTNRVEADGQNLIPVLHTLYMSDRDFKHDVNSAMRAAFGDEFDELVFPPAADQRIQLRLRWKTLRREQSAADLSDGTLRFLLLLTILASPTPAPLIAIDEPETGLHPSMLPIITEYAAEAAKRTQVVFTTHSPQFLDTFHNVKHTATVAKWQNGETLLRNLSGDDLKDWLKEYSLGSLFLSGELEGMA